MPYFDTRKPQEPDRPSRLHLFVAASRQHTSALAGRSLTSARALLRNRTVMRRLGLVGLSISFLAVLAWILTAWAGSYVETHSEQVDQKLDWAVETPSEQLDQKIKRPLSTTYDYKLVDEDPGGYGRSVAPPCDLDKCFGANISASDADPATLATITEAAVNSCGGRNGSVGFSEQGIGYCFASKQAALDNLGGGLKEADMLGRIDKCYIAVSR